MNAIEEVESIATKGPFAILDLVPSWLWAIMVAALLALCGFERIQVMGAEVKAATSEQQRALAQAGWEKSAREASELNRKVEQLYAKAKEKIDATVAQERSKTAAGVRAGDDRRSVLVNATAHTTAPSGASPSDPAALARAEQKAAAFGQLLGSCDRVAADLGRDVEDLATQVRGLQAQYESLIVGAGLSGVVSGRPLANGDHVDPGDRPVGSGVVNASLPVASFDP